VPQPEQSVIMTHVMREERRSPELREGKIMKKTPPRRSAAPKSVAVIHQTSWAWLSPDLLTNRSCCHRLIHTLPQKNLVLGCYGDAFKKDCEAKEHHHRWQALHRVEFSPSTQEHQDLIKSNQMDRATRALPSTLEPPSHESIPERLRHGGSPRPGRLLHYRCC
jgi:hypothetical protein